MRTGLFAISPLAYLERLRNSFSPVERVLFWVCAAGIIGATTITLPNPTLTTPTLTTPIFQTAPLSDGAHFAAPSRLPPGLGAIQWFVRPGSKPGTCQVKVQVGNSNEETPVAGLDNLPAGTSGC